MNVYSTQPLADFIDRLRLLGERHGFGTAFILKLDELARLTDLEAEWEQLEQDREDLETRVAELEAKLARLTDLEAEWEQLEQDRKDLEKARATWKHVP